VVDRLRLVVLGYNPIAQISSCIDEMEDLPIAE
jgi:hypothetical protein